MLKNDIIKICFIGNPNVGKSTLINRLINSNDLKTSKDPGTTKNIEERSLVWNKKKFIFLDTAGVYKKKNFNFTLLTKATRLSQIIILIIDSTIDRLEKIHKRLASHTIKVGKGLIIIFNKWDLVINKKSTKKKMEKIVTNALPQVDKNRILFISALRDTKFNDILKDAIKIKSLLLHKVSTSSLNKWLKNAVKLNPPIKIKGKEIKFKYIAQTNTNPPTFTIFSNYPKKISFSYKRFLEKQLKINFRMVDVPIFLKFAATKNPYQLKKK